MNWNKEDKEVFKGQISIAIGTARACNELYFATGNYRWRLKMRCILMNIKETVNGNKYYNDTIKMLLESF